MAINPVTSASARSREAAEAARSKPAEFAGEVEGEATFTVERLFDIPGMREGSDLFPLPGNRFGGVSDRQDKLFIFNDKGELKRKIDLPRLQNGSSQLEAGTYDPNRKRFVAVREESAEMLIWKLNLKDDDSSEDDEIELDERIQLPPFGDHARTNKGVEGMAYLRGEFSPTGRPQLLVANEAFPRNLFLFETDGKAKGREERIDRKKIRMPIEVKVEAKVRRFCRDFSAVTVDPKTGDVFVSSDESRNVVQLRLKKEHGEVIGEYVAHFSLEKKNGDKLERIEGLAFDGDGNLKVMTENRSRVYELKRK